MKRLLLYIGILAAVLAVPAHPVEIEKLIPVQVVAVRGAQGTVLLETDTGNRGEGETVEQALEELRQTAPGDLCLDTVRYLLIGQGLETEVEALSGELKNTAKVCVLEGTGDLSLAADYLDAHGDLPGLRAWQRGAELPVLTAFEDFFIFLKKVENNA